LRRLADADGISLGPARKPVITVPSASRDKRPAPSETAHNKTIERTAGAPIDVEELPTVADLRARRSELTRAALRESVLEDDLERFRVVVEGPTDGFDSWTSGPRYRRPPGHAAVRRARM
jgi:hypothetical protein